MNLKMLGFVKYLGKSHYSNQGSLIKVSKKAIGKGKAMGGSGSGRWGAHVKRTTVESCCILDIGWIVKDGGLLRPESEINYWLRDRHTGRINYHFTFWEDSPQSPKFLVVEYQINQEPIRYNIVLKETIPTFGGTRLWMYCPLLKNGVPCNRRVTKLYMPTNGKWFGCRECWNLTYTSSQESHQFDGLFKGLAVQTGVNFEFIKEALGDQYKIVKRKNRNKKRWRRLPL